MTKHEKISASRAILESRTGGAVFAVLPGLALCALLALLALLLQRLSGMSALNPIVLSIALGMIVRNAGGTPASAAPGLAFAMRPVLRLGIILLGLQITLGQIASLGITSFVVVVATMALSFVVILKLGESLGVPRPMTELIAAGTSVCGAAAVIAANTVSRGRDEDVAYAIACVSILGTVSLVIYPYFGRILGLDEMSFGLWTGATVHEVAQVTAAAHQYGDTALQSATVSKLSRVVLLVAVVGALVWRRRNEATEAGAGAASVPLPYYVFGFLALVMLNSAMTFPEQIHTSARAATTLALCIALAAMGLMTDLRKLRSEGIRPLLLACLGWVFIAVTGLALLNAAGF